MKKERITLKAVELVGRYEFGTWFNHRLVTHYIYKFVTEDGKIYVWKTTKYAGFDKKVVDPRNPELVRYEFDGIGKGDILDITATIKGESEYKGEPQTDIERVKLLGRSYKAETPAERKARIEAENAEIAREQRESLSGEDKIVRMDYKRYKEHYSDCETVKGSYRCDKYSPATIEVIVREGREKPSGVRGKRIEPYTLINDENGRSTWYYAVCVENAIKRAEKELGGKWRAKTFEDYQREKEERE